MTDTMSRIRTPWHLWVVGAIAVLWNGFGCFDYTLTQTQGLAWLESMGMTQPQIDYFNAMPAWTHATWALGVWGGFLGGVLLLLRRRWAFPVFVVSFLGWLGGAIYAFFLSNGLEAMGSMWPMQLVIGAACLFFIWYARMMAAKGVLR